MIEIITLFAVYLSIFLFGMIIMRIGLFNLSAVKMRDLILKVTNSPLKGMIVGTIATATIQSSSAIMVLTIGLIATGILSFKNSIGIILGTNIGTTVTAELITFDLYYSTIPLLLIGAVFLFNKNQTIFSTGCILFGFGCLFVAMNGFGNLATPLASIPFIQNLVLLANDHQLIGIGIGTFLTAIIQSSTATTGIIMAFLNENILTLSSGISIILGANIGTCITAYIASLGTNNEAKLAVFTHIWLNILGVIIFYPTIHLLSDIAISLSSFPDIQLAHVSVIFNVLSSIIALPLVGYLAIFIINVHGRRV